MELITQFELTILELITKFDNLFDFLKIGGATIFTWIWWVITQFGDKFIIIGVLGLFYWCINKEKGEKIAFAIISSLIVNSLLKTAFNRARPFTHPGYENVNKLGNLSNHAGSSFPSGHSQNAATTFSAIALHERSLGTMILAIVVITLVPLSRVYLGVHFPTDTIVGVLVGLGVSYLVYLLMTYFYNQKFIFYIGLLVLATPFLFVDVTGETAHSFYASYGLLVGFIVGIFIENKCINFTCDVSLKTKILRLLIGAAIVAGAYGLYKVIDIALLSKLINPLKETNLVLFANIDNIYTALGYSIISVLSFGIIPFIFKNQKR